MHLFSHLTRQQWQLLGILGLWAIFGSYWYTCNIKYLCKNTPSTISVTEHLNTSTQSGALVASVTDAVNGTPATLLATLTPVATWDALKTNPVLVYFATNKDTVVTENVEPVLRNIVAYLADNPSEKIVITGHANAHKDKHYAIALGLERAKKVKELLVSLGAPAQSILVSSLGDTQLAAPATTAANQALNRRAVISVARPDAFDIKY